MHGVRGSPVTEAKNSVNSLVAYSQTRKHVQLGLGARV